MRRVPGIGSVAMRAVRDETAWIAKIVTSTKTGFRFDPTLR